MEFYIREITQGSKKKTYGPYKGYIEKLKEPIELKGRIIRYKPVAKLSGKSGKKMKGGGENNSSESNNNNRKFAAGPAPENNNIWDKLEQIAKIKFTSVHHENTDDFDKKIKELQELDKNRNIFDIEISCKTENTVWQTDKKTKETIIISFVNLSKAKKNKNLEKKINDLIEILKFFKNQETDKKFYTKFTLDEPNEKLSTEHNEFLKILANKIK